MRVIRSELRALAKSQFTVPQYRILVHLLDGPLNNGQLAEIQGVSVAAMSRMVDGLVKRDLLKRIEASTDRRQTYLGLTNLGQCTVEKLIRNVQKGMAIRISKLDPITKKALASGLSALKEMFP